MKIQYTTWFLLAAVSWWCFALGVPYFEKEPLRFLRYDPVMQYLGVRSVVEDGDLDVRNQVDFHEEVVRDQSALGARGEWYPLHETLLIFFAVPFYWVFGVSGLWLFNICMTTGLTFFTYAIARRHTSDQLACALSLLVTFSTPLALLSYNFSIDMLAVLGICATFVSITSGRPWLAGLCLGLSIWGRLANVATIPAFTIYAIYKSTKTKSPTKYFLCLIAGGLPIAAIIASLNYHMFGGVLETAYHHNQHYIDGRLEVVTQTALWSVPMLRGIWNIIFNLERGILFSWPPLLPILLLGFQGYFRRDRSECLLALALMASVILFYGPYAGAVDLGGGVRHFLLVYALSIGYCVSTLDRFSKNSTRIENLPTGETAN